MLMAFDVAFSVSVLSRKGNLKALDPFMMEGVPLK